MVKKLKRIFTVILLILTVVLVGCLFYTGNRLTNYPKNLEVFNNGVFEKKDDVFIAFKDDGIWYQTGNQEIILLQIKDYSEGVIISERENKTYRFVVVDKDTIYDESSRKILIRRIGGG